MQINARSLRGRELGSILTVSEQARRLKLPDLPDLAEAAVVGKLTVLGDRLLLEAELAAEIEQVCARCLKPYQHRLTTAVAEEFSETPTGEQFGYAGDRLNLQELLRTVVVLALPPVPLHSADCRGLCPVCGKDLNEQPHQHDQQDDNHPFAELRRLKTK